ncbi:hypothetical protein [Dechloromonas sp. ZS-1]|uniref:hypothetical protein n=1 Tax=Dechloromonas sp. ZS-1 TaxID=3138067 RepID=UPI0031FC9A48
MSDVIVRKPRHIGHKIALACALGCGVLMVPAILGFLWMWMTYGTANTWTPSMAAVVAFLGCCAGVLYATSVPQPLLPPEDQAPQA